MVKMLSWNEIKGFGEEQNWSSMAYHSWHTCLESALSPCTHLKFWLTAYVIEMRAEYPGVWQQCSHVLFSVSQSLRKNLRAGGQKLPDWWLSWGLGSHALIHLASNPRTSFLTMTLPFIGNCFHTLVPQTNRERRETDMERDRDRQKHIPTHTRARREREK